MPPSHPPADEVTLLGAVTSSIRRARRSRTGAHHKPPAAEVLTALAGLRELRSRLDAWEPELIAAARAAGASWADLAPVLGVASRQAAERRYLRLRRPYPDEAGLTGDERVTAERDRRATDRAVTAWARANGADLRQLAGQISALTDLGPTAQSSLDKLHEALGDPDASALPGLLADTERHLPAGHATLADRVRAVSDDVDRVRASTHRQRSAHRDSSPRPAEPAPGTVRPRHGAV